MGRHHQVPAQQRALALEAAQEVAQRVTVARPARQFADQRRELACLGADRRLELLPGAALPLAHQAELGLLDRRQLVAVRQALVEHPGAQALDGIVVLFQRSRSVLFSVVAAEVEWLRLCHLHHVMIAARARGEPWPRRRDRFSSAESAHPRTR